MSSPIYKSWGVDGIKFGFVHVGSFRWTTWMHEAVRKCAGYGLMVDIHDEYRPTGFSRTYQNLMTQEGILSLSTFWKKAGCMKPAFILTIRLSGLRHMSVSNG